MVASASSAGGPGVRRVDAEQHSLVADHHCTVVITGLAATVVLVDDRLRVAVRDFVLISQPVDPFLEAEQRWAVIDFFEPLGKLSSGHVRDPCDEDLMGLLGVLVRHARSSWVGAGG